MNQKLILRISAIISGLSGLVILAGVLYPIVSYDSKFSANYDSLISPISGKKEAATIEEVDYTRASNWFVGGAAQEDFISSKVEYYDRKGTLVKTADFLDYQSFMVAGKNIFRPGKIHMKNVQTKKQSIFSWDKRKLGENLLNNHFSQDSLK